MDTTAHIVSYYESSNLIDCDEEPTFVAGEYVRPGLFKLL